MSKKALISVLDPVSSPATATAACVQDVNLCLSLFGLLNLPPRLQHLSKATHRHSSNERFMTNMPQSYCRQSQPCTVRATSEEERTQKLRRTARYSSTRTTDIAWVRRLPQIYASNCRLPFPTLLHLPAPPPSYCVPWPTPSASQACHSRASSPSGCTCHL